MTLDAARAMDAGAEARVEIASSSSTGRTMLHNVIDRAIQVHGALGRHRRHAAGARCTARPATRRIYDGPDEVHRGSVARRLLKDPGSAPWA